MRFNALIVLCATIAASGPTKANAAEPKDVARVIELVTHSKNGKISILYYLFLYDIEVVTYQDGKPELVQVVARAPYQTLQEKETYICIDWNRDGISDYGQYKQGLNAPIVFYSPQPKENPDTKVGKARNDCQGLYNMAMRRAGKMPFAESEEPN